MRHHIRVTSSKEFRHVLRPQATGHAHRRRGPAGPPEPDPHRRAPFRQRPPAEGALSRRATRRRCSASAASGAPSASSGSSARASTSPPSAMPAARPRTRPTRRSAPAGPATTRSVLVVYDPERITYEELLKTFWESHDPTQGMRQGNDVGTQYRSGIYVYDAGAAGGRGGLEGRLPGGARRRAATARSRPRSARRRRSTSPRTITSNISPRTRAAIAASAAPASPARSAPASRPDRDR